MQAASATEGAPSQEDSAGADGHRGPGLAGPPATCGSACSSRHPGIARSIRKNECCSGRPSRNSPPLCSPATSISQPSPWKNCRSHRILRQNNRRKPTQNPLVLPLRRPCVLSRKITFFRTKSLLVACDAPGISAATRIAFRANDAVRTSLRFIVQRSTRSRRGVTGYRQDWRSQVKQCGERMATHHRLSCQTRKHACQAARAAPSETTRSQGTRPI